VRIQRRSSEGISIHQKTVSDSYVQCNKCSSCFNISHGRRSYIKSHLSTDTIKRALSASVSSSTLNNFFIRSVTFGEKEMKLAATE
jgi:hypothetical protein